MKFLNDHIKSGQFKNVYLVYGEERYLVQQYKNRLKEAMIGEDTMNYTYFEGRKTDVNQLIDVFDTLPFFAEKKLVLIENSGYFKSANDKLTDYIHRLPPYLYLVFIEEEVDKRGKLYKAVNQQGYAAEMKYQSEGVLDKWITGLVQKEGKQISGPAKRLLLTKCGVEMENIRSETEKLICYCMDRAQIEEADVEAVCTTRTANRIFDMVTAIALHRQRQALELYYDLLLLKEPPMRILYLITRQFNLLLQVRELSEQHLDNATMARQMGIAPFLVGKYLGQAKGFSSATLKEALYDMASMEEAVKTGNMQDQAAVELIIIKYSRKEG